MPTNPDSAPENFIPRLVGLLAKIGPILEKATILAADQARLQIFMTTEDKEVFKDLAAHTKSMKLKMREKSSELRHNLTDRLLTEIEETVAENEALIEQACLIIEKYDKPTQN